MPSGETSKAPFYDVKYDFTLQPGA
jgi:hypothetical protein